MNFAWQGIHSASEAASSSAAGAGASIEWHNFAPPGLIPLAFLACAFVVLFSYWHERPSVLRPWKVLLGVLRTSLIAIIVIVLYGWTIHRYRTNRPDLILLIDDSASMGLVDAVDNRALGAEIQRRIAKAHFDSASRLNLAKLLLLEGDSNWLTTLGQRFHLRLYSAGASARLVGLGATAESVRGIAADEDASRLGNCIRQIVEAQRGRPTAAILMFTDGITTDGKPLNDAAELARRQSIPLYLVGLGSDRPARDLKLDDLIVDDAVFAGDLLRFSARLSAQGYSDNATVRLRRVDGMTVLTERKVPLPDAAKSGGSQIVHLEYRAESPGDFEYVIEVIPRDDESNFDNNRLTRRVLVRDDLVRVLLVQAYPSYEFRFLKQVLLRGLNSNQPAESKAVGFRTVLQEADLNYDATDTTAERAFPASREELFQYDVLIFGDVDPSLLSRSMMDNIYEFVTVRGGGLIFSAGPRFTPLAFRGTPIGSLLPIDADSAVVLGDSDLAIEPFRPQLTALGRSSPFMQLAESPTNNDRLWSEQLAPLQWLLDVAHVRPGVRVLAEHPTRRMDGGTGLPVITLHFIGAGKVVFHATDETYRWRFRAGDVYFARYWMQTIRYLCRSQLLSSNGDVELTTDREEYRRGDAIELRLRFLDDRLAPEDNDAVAIVIEDESQHRQQVTLHRQGSERGMFAGSAGLLADGQYIARLLSPALNQPPSNRFRVTPPPDELSRTTADHAELRQAAQISMGKSYTFATAKELLSDLPPPREVRIQSLPAVPIWNSWIVATWFVVLITLEWVVRKRLSLL